MLPFSSHAKVRKHGAVALLLIGLFLLALVSLVSETTQARAAQVEPQKAQKIQIQELSMIDQQKGWALEKGRTRVFFTTKGLLSWKNVTPPGLNLTANDPSNSVTASYFLDAKHGYLGVLQNGATSLLQTQDSGKTWSTTNFDFSPFTGIGIYQIQFLDAKHGWAAFLKDYGFGKYLVVLESTVDGGKTWQQLFDMTVNDASGLPTRGPKAFHFTSPQNGWVTGPEDQAGNARLYATSDGGATWAPAALPALPVGTYSVSYGPYFTNAKDGTLPVRYGFQDGSDPNSYLLTYRTRDGGKTWIASTAVLKTPATNELTTLSFRNAEQGWVIGLDSNGKPILHRTTDGGKSWKTVHPQGLKPFTTAIFDFDLLSSTKATVINSADDGTLTLFQTSDGGQHWSALQPRLG